MGIKLDWATVAHRAVVSRHVWRQRVARGWDVETALTTPFVERRDLRTRVREILAHQPDATPQDVARLLGEIGTAHTKRVMESIGKATAPAEPPRWRCSLRPETSMSEATQEQIYAVFAELGIGFPLRNEITIAKALVEARVTLAAATKRAEAAEAECDALRQDVARYRWLRDNKEREVAVCDIDVCYYLDGLDAYIDAALAVQPTTGETDA